MGTGARDDFPDWSREATTQGLRFTSKENYKEYGRRWNGSRNLEKPKETVTEVVKSRRLLVPKNYRVVEEINYYSDMTGFTRYMKAIRIGGEDYGEGKPHEQYFDGGRISVAIRPERREAWRSITSTLGRDCGRFPTSTDSGFG